MKKILAYILLLLTFTAVPAAMSATTLADAHEGIESAVAENTATVTSSNGGLVIANPGEATLRFHVFSITGQMVKSVDVAPGEQASIDLPTGCYIVKCSQWSKKIVVR